MQQDIKEVGFESITTNQRLINHDGSSNIRRRGINRFAAHNFYHSLVTMPVWSFLLVIVGFFILINVLFGTIYYFVGVEDIGVVPDMNYRPWVKMFFLSAQTITSTGYGQIEPVSFWINVISSTEALIGLMFFAIMTGVLYGRFSKPTAKLTYSKNAIITPFKDLTSLNIRIVNSKISQLIEVEAQLIVSLLVNNGNKLERIFLPVKLVNDKVAILATIWNVMHVIDKNSPFYNMNEEEMKKSDVELIYMIKAIDDTYGQEVHTRTSYKWYEVIHSAKFAPAVKINKGVMEVDIKKIGILEKIS